jgi:hypothetical protein
MRCAMDTLDTCLTLVQHFVWNVYQLCSLKLQKKKKNVNMGCLKTLGVCGCPMICVFICQ